MTNNTIILDETIKEESLPLNPEQGRYSHDDGLFVSNGQEFALINNHGAMELFNLTQMERVSMLRPINRHNYLAKFYGENIRIKIDEDMVQVGKDTM